MIYDILNKCGDNLFNINHLMGKIGGEKLENFAHELKSTFVFISGKKALEQAIVLEYMGKTNNFIDASKTFHNLQGEIKQILITLNEKLEGEQIEN